MSDQRLTPEREAEIRNVLRTGRAKVSYVFIARDLLAELDAVRREREDASDRIQQLLFDLDKAAMAKDGGK